MLILLASLAANAACPATVTHNYVPVVQPTSITVWARLSAGQVSAHAEYSVNGGETWTSTSSQTSQGSDGYTLAFPITGLSAASAVQHRIKVEGDPACVATPTRTTTTAPATTSVVNFGFAVTSDARPTLTEGGPPWEAIAAKNPAFLMQIGDWDHRDPGEGNNTSITTWRNMHRDMLGDAPVGSTLAQHVFAAGIPLFHMWDDHDYCENNADRNCAGKASAQEAFGEFFPRPNSPTSGAMNYSFRWGQVEVFVLDTRSKRDPNDEQDGSGHSMLGWGTGSQRDWVKNGVENSTAVWKIVVTPTQWNPDGKQIDTWANFQHEQGVLINAWSDVDGVILVSGDLHSWGLIDDGTHSTFPELSVPSIDIDRDGCTGGPSCGDWSHPGVEEHPHAGFGWIEVWRDGSGDHLRLATYDADGTERQHLDFTP